MSKRLLYWSAGLSMFAILSHSIAAPEHLNEWWGYGTIFVTGAVLQFFYGIALLIQPWKYDDKGGVRNNADYYGRSYYMLGIILTAFMILVYIITRTTGMPFFGSDAVTEPVTVLGLIPVLVNVILVFLLIRLFQRSKADNQPVPDTYKNKTP